MKSVANASVASATVPSMVGETLQHWRRERLRALAEKVGGNAELGRKLGYSDGAFVGQMVNGHRPVSEKTIEQAEKLPGARGWFKQEDAQAAPPAKGGVFEELTPEEKAFIEDFRAILDSDRQRIVEQVSQRAAELREYLEQHASAAVPLVARPRHAAASKGAPAKTATPLRRVDPNQAPLPLEAEDRR